MFQCWEFRGKLVRDSLDHSKQFGTRIISVAICYGSIHRMTGLIARHRNHLVFTLRCKETGITPPSLNLKCPINTQKARRIVDKAKKDLVRERVRIIINKLSYYKEQQKSIDSILGQNLNEEDFHLVRQHISKVSEVTFNKTKRKHIEKLERLEKRNNKTDEPDLSGSQLKRWVINLSDYDLSKDQEKVLARGLNFAVTPDKIPVNEIIVATEQATWCVSNEKKDSLRAEICGILKSAKRPNNNLTQNERHALKELQKEKSITILPADKGRATVILKSQEYQDKMNGMLSDRNTYEKLKKDPTQKYKSVLIKMLGDLEKAGKITKDQYWFLYPTLEKVPRMYGSPKIHKEGTPLRPIVDYTQTIAYRLSRAIADILQPLVGKTKHHTENSKELVKELSEVKVEKDEMMVSYDRGFSLYEDPSIYVPQ